MKTFSLKKAPLSDQRFPCSVRLGESCPRRAQFRIYPRCSCGHEIVQVCTEHLARSVRVATARCTHFGMLESVIVQPLGSYA